ncbi:hypothetical protein [Thalassomonas sp. M1454]|uniref:hypothetical protein n=1 Tax=Thalassomonas sp. M1454 TaxID=2594477 RepID=UPI00117BE5EC|nr:hypothetical protein [Thalassomonas sp. M1454]TRX56691.1 hypothetical protein FNN08_03955 [Thalassomonas sp. M1454]
MALTPKQIISESLNVSEQRILNAVLSIEKRKLHVKEIKANSRDEREILDSIMKIVDKELPSDS